MKLRIPHSPRVLLMGTNSGPRKRRPFWVAQFPFKREPLQGGGRGAGGGPRAEQGKVCTGGSAWWGGSVQGSRRGEGAHWESSHLRGPVQLVEAQFPRLAGILGIRRRRHGDRARTPHQHSAAEEEEEEESGWGGEREAVLGGPPLRRPRPSRGAPRGARPHPAAPAVRAPTAAAPLLRLGLPDRIRSARSRLSDSSSRRRRRHGPGAGPYVTSASPSDSLHRRPPPSSLPPPTRGDVTGARAASGTRRGRGGFPARGVFPARAWHRPRGSKELAARDPRATWGRVSAPSLPVLAPLGGLRPAGRGLARRDPWRDRSGLGGRGHLPRPASPGGPGRGGGGTPVQTRAQLLRNPLARGPRGWVGGCKQPLGRCGPGWWTRIL